jgi:hypothetical protein
MFAPKLCVAAALAAIAVPATASVRFGDVLIETRSTFTGFTIIEEEDGGTVAPGDPQIFTTLIQPPGLARFPTSPAALPAGFASSTFTALRLGGVGISGWALNRFTTEAVAVYTQTLFNDSDQPLFLALDYMIPNMEVAVQAGPSILRGPEATARAALNVEVCNADLSSCFDEDVFSYRITADKVADGVAFTRSPDLLIDAGEGSRYTQGDVEGLRYGPFSGTTELFIPAGGLLDFRYAFTAFGQTSTPETGYQAFVGDPFNISSGGELFRFRVIDAPAIPEPGTWAMLIAGFALLGGAARRRGKPGYSQTASGGRLIRMASMLPPVLRPNRVPRS